MDAGILVCLLLAAPPAGAALSWAWGSPRGVLRHLCAGMLLIAGAACGVAALALSRGPISTAAEWLVVDALSAYHLIVLALVYATASVFALEYFGEEIARGAMNLRQTRIFSGLWFGSFGAMTLVFTSNNLGIMWVGIEATTLLTAFLISTHASPGALEAMWKYLLICSVGVAFAFMGTLLVAASTHAVTALGPTDVLLWTKLRAVNRLLDPSLIRVGFVFLLVGYGTKAGLAPMHSWLPDAHSQAPAPVSAIFSGFLLNTALYCVVRYLPIVNDAPGNAGWAGGLLTVVGLFSIVLAAAFILFQHDVKRLLAYHSVEHMGIIALGLGLGGPGVFAALFHTLNHSTCKTLAFVSAGRLGQRYGTHDMARLTGIMRASPVWGAGFTGSLLALIGVAPFAVFMSEFYLCRAAWDRGAYTALAIFLCGAAIVFAGALRHVIDMTWGDPPVQLPGPHGPATGVVIVPSLLALLLLLGLSIPAPLMRVLTQAAAVVTGAP